MLGATLKSLFARKFRLLMSALSIVLGIAFVAGSLMFTNLLSRGFDEIVSSTVGDVNVVPAGTGFTDFNAVEPADATGLSPDDVAAVDAIDGITETEALTTSAQVFLLDTEGRLVAVQGAPGIGSNWHETPAAGGLTGTRIVDGRAPTADGEVVVDPSTVERSGHAIGDTVEISTPFAGIQEFTLVGTATYGSGSTVGASYLFFTLHDAQRMFTEGRDVSTGLWITTAPDADVDAVAAEVASVLPDGWDARTGQSMAEELEDLLGTGMGFVNAFLLIFAAIALLVATLLILNTFAILVAQRAREMALLRAIGATRAQVRRSVLLEAVIVGLIGSVLGIAVGYGLVWGLLAIMARFGMGMGDARPELTWTAVGVSLAMGIVVTAVAALVPAMRASRTRPVEALADASVPKEDTSGSALTMSGIVCIELAIALIVCGAFLDVPRPLWWVGGGAALLLIGMVLAAALVGSPVIWLFGRLFRGAFGEIGRMAERNSKRQPRRTAATAATLMIGLALVTTVAVLASSVTTSTRDQLSADQRGDFVLTPIYYAPFDATIVDEVAAVDGVDWVAGFAPGQATAEGSSEPVAVVGTSARGLLEGSATDVVAGTMTDEPDSAVISVDFASQHHLSLGMLFDLTGDAGSARVLVTGVMDDDATDVVLHTETMAKITSTALVNRVVVFDADGADRDAVREGLRQATVEQPTVVVSDVAQFVDERVEQFQQIFTVLYALLGLALVISVLGIVNTLSLSVVERTREVGLLRAVGVTRRQIRRMVSLESVLITVMGSVLGVALGLLFGVLLQRVNRDAGIGTLDIPWLQLGAFVLVTAVFGWLAAIVPARRAARLPVLESIANQ